MFVSTVEISKICCAGLACHAMLISVVYLIENNHHKYHKGAGVWIAWMTRFIMLTSLLTLAMDYSNTKNLVNGLILGYAAAAVPDMFKRKYKRQAS